MFFQISKARVEELAEPVLDRVVENLLSLSPTLSEAEAWRLVYRQAERRILTSRVMGPLGKW